MSDAQHAEDTRRSQELHDEADEMGQAAEALEDKAEGTRHAARAMDHDTASLRDRAEELHEQANRFDSNEERE